MSRPAPPWSFGYAPASPAADLPEPTFELCVATETAFEPGGLAAAAGPGASAETLLARAPIFWTRLLLEQPAQPAAVAERLRRAGVPVRYVASAARPSLALGPPFDWRGAAAARPRDWRAPVVPLPPLVDTPGRWFLGEGEGGVAVDRARCGVGAGRRLAVIDDDALAAEQLDLDAEVLVELPVAPRHQAHGPLMVAWAVRARRFAGVAPGASARLYLVPKPGRSAVALPLALARAVLDGADVVVCATYVEGSTSPMLDDALELAARLGRQGRGTAVVLPTGREASSVPGSLHASFSLGLGEPASDPRVFCVAPGARGGGWFLWRDRRGRLRPFANRGPAVRWLSPGDDLAYPFAAAGAPERLFHAESSGAAAVAAGVLLLVLGANPTLRLPELGAIVDATLTPAPLAAPARPEPLADPADLLPSGRDRDGHDARHGHGLLHAGRACLAARDPFCAALTAMGEDDAARAWADLRRRDRRARCAYSRRVARWAVRALLAEPELARALRVVVRHLRLVSPPDGRLAAHGDGALVRQLGLLLRRLGSARPPAPPSVRAELADLGRRLEALGDDPALAAHLERTLAALAAPCFAAVRDSPEDAPGRPSRDALGGPPG